MNKQWAVTDEKFIRGLVVGDIFADGSDGNNYRVIRKTTTAIAVERYFWFDRFADWVVKKVGSLIK